MFGKGKGSQPKCLVCKIAPKEVFKKCGEYTYYRCKKCDGIFADPIHAQDFYLQTDTYLSDPLQYTATINPYGQRWIIEQFERLYQEVMGDLNKGTFFEVGAGVGYLVLMALARGWEAKGIEISEPSAQFARDYLRVNVTRSTIEDYPVKDAFNAIVMVEVLEHFLDPLAAIKAMRRLSHKQTFLFGTTPNSDSQHWQSSEQNIYVPEDHIFLFNEKSLRCFADKAGIRDLKVEFFGSGDKHDSNLMYAGIISH